MVSTVISGTKAVSLASAPSLVGTNNTMTVTVDKGPANNSVNQPYVSVTICQPGSSTQCQTIDHILVDTGSTGLRVLASAMSSNFQLNMVRNASNLPVLNCVNFLDTSYAWGPLVTADVRMGGEVANGLPIQVIGAAGFNSFGSACSSTGSAITLASDLGANGIIGVGLAPQDCGVWCDPQGYNVRNNNTYFACATEACTAVNGTTLAVTSQIQHPAVVLPTDNNGVALVLPQFVNNPSLPATSPGELTMSGQLVFGLGTQANNAFTGLTVLFTGTDSHTGLMYMITTEITGASLGTSTPLSSSFIDSGSNGTFFDSSTLQACSGQSAGLYCPSYPNPGTAVLIDSLGNRSPTVSFSITSADDINLARSYAVRPTFSGTVGNRYIFDWGLPFFYGRTVAFGIDGKVISGMGTGPFYAF